MTRLGWGVGLLALVGVTLAAGATMAWSPSDRVPPRPTPPPVYKFATSTELSLGDEVQFQITVRCPDPPENPLPWYDVQTTDAISPALTIEGARVIPDDSEHDIAVVDHTVIATATEMAPSEWYVVVIDCRLVDASELGPSIVNQARVMYEDEAGQPHGPLPSDPVTITVVPSGKRYVPLLLQGYSLR